MIKDVLIYSAGLIVGFLLGQSIYDWLQDYILKTREPLFPDGSPCIPEGRERIDPWSDKYNICLN